MLYCPACDEPYANWPDLRDHLKKAQTEGDTPHLDILEGEEWDLSAATIETASTDEV